MTQAQIEEIVKAWIPLLGLTHWNISVLWGEDAVNEFPDIEKHHASIWRSKDYDEARLAVGSKYVDWTAKEANRHLVHELLHCVMRDVEFTVDHLLDGYLHTDAEKIWVDTFRHHTEGAIDRLAYRFVEIAGVQ